jgi:hypothetical protein
MFKKVHGVIGSCVVIASAIAILTIGLSSSKASNFQRVATSCTVSGDDKSSECNELLKFGVEQTAYFNDEQYRNDVDRMYIRAIENNANIAPKIAQFTLDYGVKKNVKFVAKVYEKLHQLTED